MDVTVGICAHNEEDTIGKLLEQVMEEDVPLAEVIVVTAGEDSTSEIVAAKAEEYGDIVLVEEDERRGHIFAQNEILSRMTGEALLFLDGDGTIRPGSIEELYDRYDGNNLVSGREIPVTDDSFTGRILDVYEDIHHRHCLLTPRFSTQIGLLPADLMTSFPEIMVDDLYTEHRASVNGLPIEYVPSAVKYHNIPNSLRVFYQQQKRNWAGRLQANQRNYEHARRSWRPARFYFRYLMGCPVRRLPAALALGVIEIFAYAAARYHQITGRFPVNWERPGSE